MALRTLITGGSGFVGANLVRRVLADGHDVHLLLRPGHDAWRLRDVIARTTTHAVDVQDRAGVQAAVAAIRPDWVFHLAAYGAYPSQAGLDRMMATNVSGCVNLLDACRVTGVGAFVNAGSSSEYGFAARATREDDRLAPNSEYAITKAAATHYCQLASRRGPVNAVTVRLYSVYGPFEAPERLVPSLLVHALDGRWPALVAPETARDFVYVDDAVEAMLRVAAAPGLACGAIYNVCTGVQTTVGEVVAAVGRMLPVRTAPAWGSLGARAWDTQVWVGSPERLAADLGWRAATGVETGLRHTLGWLQADAGRLRSYQERVFRPAAV